MADLFYKDLFVLGCGSLLGSCKYSCLFYPGRGGGQVEYFSRYPLVFGGFYEEVWDQGRVWGLSGNFDKDLLVLRLDFLRVL